MHLFLTSKPVRPPYATQNSQPSSEFLNLKLSSGIFLLTSAIAFDNNEMPSIRISEKKNPNCNYQNTYFIISNVALENWNNTNMFLKFFAA